MAGSRETHHENLPHVGRRRVLVPQRRPCEPRGRDGRHPDQGAARLRAGASGLQRTAGDLRALPPARGRDRLPAAHAALAGHAELRHQPAPAPHRPARAAQPGRAGRAGQRHRQRPARPLHSAVADLGRGRCRRRQRADHAMPSLHRRRHGHDDRASEAVRPGARRTAPAGAAPPGQAPRAGRQGPAGAGHQCRRGRRARRAGAGRRRRHADGRAAAQGRPAVAAERRVRAGQARRLVRALPRSPTSRRSACATAPRSTTCWWPR